MFNEQKFSDFSFSPFILNINEDKNYNNFPFLRTAIDNENAYFVSKIAEIQNILDKLTDLCEYKGFLKKDVLEGLLNYLKEKTVEILQLLPVFYKENYTRSKEGKGDFENLDSSFNSYL